MSRKHIEVNGVRFTAEEVKYVVIRRNGRDITLGEKEADDGAVMGFRSPPITEAKVSKGGHNPPNESAVRPKPPRGSKQA